MIILIKKLHQRDEKHQINQVFSGLVAILFSTWSDGDSGFISVVKPKDTIWKGLLTLPLGW